MNTYMRQCRLRDGDRGAYTEKNVQRERKREKL